MSEIKANPILYIFLGKENTEIIEASKKAHPTGGVYFLCINDKGNIHNMLRKSKFELQQGEGYNNTAIRIYIIANASDDDAFALTQSVASGIGAIFGTDMSVFTTLAVFFSEGLHPNDDTDALRKVAWEYLRQLAQGHISGFGRIFLVSDRDENGCCSPDNHVKASRAFGYLPTLHGITSMQQADPDHVLFSAIGFGEGKIVEPTGLLAHKLADILEAEMGLEYICTPYKEGDYICAPPYFASQIAENIMAVAARHLHFYSLININLEEAEELLYGSAARIFYQENYLVKEKEICTDNMQLRHVIAWEQQLRHILDNLGREIGQAQNELAAKAQQNTGYITSVSTFKSNIGESYAARFRLEKLKTAHSSAKNHHENLKSFIEYLRNVIEAMRAIPAQLPSVAEQLQHATEQAAINIALLRDDGLARETHNIGTEKEPRILRLVSGFKFRDTAFGNL